MKDKKGYLPVNQVTCRQTARKGEDHLDFINISRLWGINSSRLYKDSQRVTFLLLETTEIQVEYVLYRPGVFLGHQIRVFSLKSTCIFRATK